MTTFRTCCLLRQRTCSLLPRSMSSLSFCSRRLLSIEKTKPSTAELIREEALDFDSMIDSVKPMLSEYLLQSRELDTRVLPECDFEQLSHKLSVDRILQSDGISNSELLAEVSCILENSVRLGHPLFFDRLYSGSDSVGQMASLLLAVMNNNAHVFAAGPSLQVLESKLIDALNRLFFEGLSPDQLQECDGIFVPGGSYANLMAARIALHRAFPEARVKGVASLKSRPVILANEQMHYSIRTNAMALGLGADSVIALKTHSNNGQIDIWNLRRELSALESDATRSAVMVCCMAGSTVLGAFDDFEAIAALCREFGVVMHADACWGGAAVFGRSQRCRELVRGLHLADVISYDAHKHFSVPLLCSAVLVKNGSELPAMCSPLGADYLYHGNGNGQAEASQKTMQCSRHGDALKLYLTLLHKGRRGMADSVQRAMANASALFELVDGDEDFVALHTADNKPMYCNVAFWFVGDGSGVTETGRRLLRQWRDEGFNADSLVKAHSEFPHLMRTLEECTTRIHAVVSAEGRALVNFSPLPEHELPSFLRPVTNNPKQGPELSERLLTIIKEAAAF